MTSYTDFLRQKNRLTSELGQILEQHLFSSEEINGPQFIGAVLTAHFRALAVCAIRIRDHDDNALATLDEVQQVGDRSVLSFTKVVLAAFSLDGVNLQCFDAVRSIADLRDAVVGHARLLVLKAAV